MIPVRGFENRKVAVLGLGRSGKATVAALEAGGAEVIAWDDGVQAREAAEAALRIGLRLDPWFSEALRMLERLQRPSRP